MTTIGMALFPNLTQLDLTGPYEVVCRMPDSGVHLVADSSGSPKTVPAEIVQRVTAARQVIQAQRRRILSWIGRRLD